MHNKHIAFWLPVVGMCGIIFLFSQDHSSLQHSDRVLSILLSLVDANSMRHVAEFAGPFRKLAHTIVYGLLSLLTYRWLKGASRHGFLPPVALRAVVFSLLYASTDEFHQIFVPGRGPAVHDVLLDGLAATLAMLALQFWYQVRPPRPASPQPAPEALRRSSSRLPAPAIRVEEDRAMVE